MNTFSAEIKKANCNIEKPCIVNFLNRDESLTKNSIILQNNIIMTNGSFTLFSWVCLPFCVIRVVLRY